MTKNGVEYNLPKSPYIYTYGETCFYFSSKYYLDKFSKNINKIGADLQTKFYKAFGYFPDYEILLYGVYLKTEKRGFYITRNMDPIALPTKIVF